MTTAAAIDRTGAAQRMLTVLDEGIWDLQLLASIPPAPSSSSSSSSAHGHYDEEHKLLARLSDRGLEHLAGPLRTQWQLERGLAALEATEAFAASRTHQRRLLQQATRQLLAALHRTAAATDPHHGPTDLLEALNDGVFASVPDGNPTAAAQALLVQKLGELKAVLARRFRSTLQQDLHPWTVLATMTERQRLAEAALGSLSAAYDATRVGTAREAAALEALRARLEGELREATAQMEAGMAGIAAEVEGAVAAMTGGHAARRAALKGEIAALEPAMVRRAVAEAAEEAALKARQAEAEAELAGLLRAYEAAVGEKRGALAALQAAVEGEEKELGELREHFAIVALQQAERRQLEEARRAAAEAKAAAEAAAAARMLRSVVKLQAVYRGFKAWKAYRAAKAPPAAAGGKKKGGKGKEKEGGKAKDKAKGPAAAGGGKAPVTVKAPAKPAAAGGKKK